jgi:hypothetical protein
LVARFAFLLATGALAANGAELALPNGSFEFPTPPPGFPAFPVIDNWQKTAQPAWFDPATTGGITWDQLSGVFPNPPTGDPSHIVNVDGDQAAYLFALPGAGVFQELPGQFEAGVSYQLIVGLMGAGGISEENTIELGLYYLDGASAQVPVATTTVMFSVAGFPDPRRLYDFTVETPTVQGGDAWAGKQIGVRLLATSGLGSGYWDADHVRVSAVPEPSPVALLLLGLGALLVVRRQERGHPAAASTEF